jgi:predicted secreted protein
MEAQPVEELVEVVTRESEVSVFQTNVPCMTIKELARKGMTKKAFFESLSDDTKIQLKLKILDFLVKILQHEEHDLLERIADVIDDGFEFYSDV